MTETKNTDKKVEITFYEDKELQHPYTTVDIEKKGDKWYVDSKEIKIREEKDLEGEEIDEYERRIERFAEPDEAALMANFYTIWSEAKATSGDGILMSLFDQIVHRMYEGKEVPSVMNIYGHSFILPSGWMSFFDTGGYSADVDWDTLIKENKIDIPPLE
jgi:hypothetical protein